MPESYQNRAQRLEDRTCRIVSSQLRSEQIRINEKQSEHFQRALFAPLRFIVQESTGPLTQDMFLQVFQPKVHKPKKNVNVPMASSQPRSPLPAARPPTDP